MSSVNTNNVLPGSNVKSTYLPCPLCGEQEANIQVALGSLGEEHGEEMFTCTSCEADFSIHHVQDFVKKWTIVLSWLDTIPQIYEE